MTGTVNMNGVLVDPAEARISIFDRGFLYGDSVYETVRVYNHAPHAFYAHLTRLRASGGRIGFEIPWDDDLITNRVRQTMEAAGLADAYLRIIATRGSGAIGLDTALAEDPQLIVIVLPLPPLPKEMYEKGRSACLVSVTRNVKMALDPQAKTGNYMNSVLALREARDRGVDEAIMLDHSGRVAEASTANVFAWIDDAWQTPPLEVGILGGITRATLLELGTAEAPVREAILWPKDLERADEVFLCSSVRELLPIVTLDGRPVGDGSVGARTKDMQGRYRTHVASQAKRL